MILITVRPDQENSFREQLAEITCADEMEEGLFEVDELDSQIIALCKEFDCEVTESEKDTSIDDTWFFRGGEVFHIFTEDGGYYASSSDEVNKILKHLGYDDINKAVLDLFTHEV